MKTTIFCVLAIVMTTGIQAQKKIKGNGVMTSLDRSTTDYDAVSFAGAFDYVLVAGKEGEIIVEGEENLLNYIRTEVKNGTLVVKTEDGIHLQPSQNKTIKVMVPFEALSAVAMAGSGDLWTKHPISSKHLNVSLAGSGDVKLDVATTSLKAKVAGSGDLFLSGNTTALEVNLAGSGDFKGFELDANDTTVTIAGSGTVEVVSQERLKARVTGSGNVTYKGNPSSKDTKVTGSGTIKS
ncbi:DUF2807 domain-containing protein [Gelidibacter sp. F2691]|nr:DUF2807 domain-containing protein [Gelidibacter sp. F2691]